VSRQSTAVLTISPLASYPWGDRIWRIAATAQLVEGSSPYWIVTPTEPPAQMCRQSEIEVATAETESVIDSILMLVAAHFGDEQMLDRLVESHNITIHDGFREIAPYYEVAEPSRSRLAKRLAGFIRLGITSLEDQSLVDANVILGLRNLGFDVEVFLRESSSTD
jgi:hypothetical protein